MALVYSVLRVSRGLKFSEEWLAEQKAKRHMVKPSGEPTPKPLKASTPECIEVVARFINGFPPAKDTALNLPYPPSVNLYWRNFQGRTVLSAQAREYRKAILAAIGPRKPLLGRLRVVVELFHPSKRKHDIDNRVKALFDALQHAGVFRDDEQIDEFTVKRMPVEKNGRCRVDIQEM